jgi:hypothetical protein
MKLEIEKLGACESGLAFVKSCASYKEAWETCQRGDWMLWIAQKLNVDLLKLTTAKALCANTVRHLMKDERSTKAIDVAILFGQGKATKEELNAASVDAASVDAASAASAAYVAANAAYASASAAYVAANAAYASASAADAFASASAASAADAFASANAASADATYYDAKKKNQLQTADICRTVLTEEVFKILNIAQ